MGGAGLRGQSAGETSICTVGVSGSGLTYRGYDVVDLAENTTFEEVAYLLLHEKLPNSQELTDYIEKLKSLRGLQPELRNTLEGIPKTPHPTASFGVISINNINNIGANIISKFL